MPRPLASLVCVVAVLLPAIAFPCGGLFCNGGAGNPPPVVQTGEKILFGFESGEVTAHVQILYAGEPRKFAWVVPTPALPTLSVGSDQLFTLLDQGTNPTFAARFTNTCAQPLSLGCAGARALSSNAGGAGGGGGSEVTVISQNPVGPFETAILATTNAKALQQWLTSNGFEVPASTEELIAPYVAKGDYFVALKLQSNKSTGDLQPIVLKYRSTEGPCVPIRLTATAAQPDMGIAVFLLGSARAVPLNYLHLVVNEARIDWQAQGTNYPAVVTAAADEAGGRGFVTDYSGTNATVRKTVQAALAGYVKSRLTTTNPYAFVSEISRIGFLGASQNVLALLQRCVPMPASAAAISPLAFYSSLRAESGQLTQTAVDQPSCADDFDALVVEPLRSAEAMMGRLPTLTRMYTTMSANEMTIDPIFVLNPDLPEVGSARTLPAEMECNSNGLPVNLTYTGSDGSRWTVPWGATLADAPALMRAEQMGERGAPVVTLDNTVRIKDFKTSTMGCHCMVAGGGSLVAMGVAILVMLARRRRFAR